MIFALTYLPPVVLHMCEFMISVSYFIGDPITSMSSLVREGIPHGTMFFHSESFLREDCFLGIYINIVLQKFK